jgi:cobalt-zinc-cadmium efflux system membrane fusion protein
MEGRAPQRLAWPILLAVLVAGIGVLLVAWLLGPAYNSGRVPEKVAEKTLASPAEPAGLQRSKGAIFVPETSPYRARIVVAPVQAKTVRLAHIFPAIIEADPARTVNVLPSVGGRVSALKVTLGDHVVPGQILATVESGDLAQAISDVEKAKAAVVLTQKVLDRARELTKIGGAALKDLEQAASDNAQAVAEQQRAETRLKTLSGGNMVSDGRGLIISAPIAGTITTLSTSAGTYINDPTQALMTISNLDKVFVTANVPENDLAIVSVNEDVEFTLIAYPGRTFRGQVTSVSGLLEPDTRRTKVRVSFDNQDGLLKPNMFASVSFVPPAVNEIVVPSSALLMNNDNTTVFIETKPWTFTRRKIDPGVDVDDGVLIRGGLSAGERIVVRGGVLLND